MDLDWTGSFQLNPFHTLLHMLANDDSGAASLSLFDLHSFSHSHYSLTHSHYPSAQPSLSTLLLAITIL